MVTLQVVEVQGVLRSEMVVDDWDDEYTKQLPEVEEIDWDDDDEYWKQLPDEVF